MTRFGTIRLRISRTREKSFLPVGLRRFQRRAQDVSMLIREAFLRGIRISAFLGNGSTTKRSEPSFQAKLLKCGNLETL